MPRGKSLILHGAIPALRMSPATGLQEARLVPDYAPPHLRGQPSANAQLFFLAPPPQLPLRPGRLNWQQQSWLEAPGLAVSSALSNGCGASIVRRTTEPACGGLGTQ